MFAGKRFLITHTLVQNIMGSTVLVFELAQYLQSQGASVLVYVSRSGEPVRSWFDQAGIAVTTDESELRLEDFDYVWINSQVLPIGFIEELADVVPDLMPCLIFTHLSALPHAPDEHPYLHLLEERLSTLSLFVAERTRDQLLPFFHTPPPTAIFPNPVLAPFTTVREHYNDRPTRFLIVSNHRPPEVKQARRLLQDLGHAVVHYGRGQDRYEQVTPEVLAQFDVVITIGKTVQYCMTSATPVFVYDHFGGVGYLTDENFQHASYANFSGRESQKKAPEVIVDQLLAGYRDAVDYHRANQPEFVRRYSIDEVLPTLLLDLQPRVPQPLEKPLARASVSAQRFGSRFYRSWGERIELGEQLQRLRQENSRLTADNERLREQTRDLRAQIVQITQSRSFRLGYSLLKPLMPIVHRARK